MLNRKAFCFLIYGYHFLQKNIQNCPTIKVCSLFSLRIVLSPSRLKIIILERRKSLSPIYLRASRPCTFHFLFLAFRVLSLPVYLFLLFSGKAIFRPVMSQIFSRTRPATPFPSVENVELLFSSAFFSLSLTLSFSLVLLFFFNIYF